VDESGNTIHVPNAPANCFLSPPGMMMVELVDAPGSRETPRASSYDVWTDLMARGFKIRMRAGLEERES
jgi:hypothetical protein